MELDGLQARIGYYFGDRSILVQALTHRSFGHENLQHRPYPLRDNERLEFLGDAVLSVVVSDLLLEAFPNSDEGRLSKMRAAVVNEKILALMTQQLGLDLCLRLGRGEQITGGSKKASILCGVFEALVAAIYLDGGFHAVYPVVRTLFGPLFADSNWLESSSDSKTKLQEFVQAHWKVTPHYEVLGSQGPEHSKKFIVSVKMQTQEIGRAIGSSKKEAEQNAAAVALIEMNRFLEVKNKENEIEN